MRRPVVAAAVVYGVGVAAGFLVSIPPAVPLACAVFGLLAALVWPRATVALNLAIVAAGAAMGAVHGQRAALACAQRWTPGNQTAILRVNDGPGPAGITTGRVLHSPEGCRGQLRLRFVSDSTPRSGQVIVAVGFFSMGGTFRIDWIRTLRHARAPRMVIRENIRGRVRRLYGPRAPLVEAMVVGHRYDLPRTVRDTFARGGVAHLLAISGLHVGLLASWIALVLRTAISRPRAALAAAALAWGYVGLLGFPAPATRAATFLTIAALAQLRERNPPLEAVLAVSVGVILSIDPAAVASVGAWLSVGAMWGAATAARLARRRNAGPIVRLVMVSSGATLLTMPITTLAFGAAAPVGVVANLVAIPLAGLAVPAMALSLVVGETLAGAAGLALAGIELVASVAASIPGGNFTQAPGMASAWPWFVAAGAVGWLVEARPRRSIVAERFGLAAALGAWSLVAIGVVRDSRRSQELVIHALDVGQGDAFALRTPRGRWVLIDAGPRTLRRDAGEDIVLPFLRRHGVDRLAAAMVSHGDADHLGGMPAVIRGVRPPVVAAPGQPLGSELFADYLKAIDDAGSEWKPARRGDSLVVDSVTFAVLHPSTEWMSARLRANENSLVVLVTYRDFDMLFTGDIGWPAESVLIDRVPAVEVLKVGHHGSSTSTSREWVREVRPQVGLISVGRENPYGHPSDVVLSRLRREGVHVYRTDEGGPVTIRSDGRYFQVSQGSTFNLWGRIRCLVQTSLRSSASSSSRNAVSRRLPGNSRVFSTTSR